MFVIRELPEWDEMQDTPVYFGGYFKEPKYGTMQPTWTADLDDAFKFTDRDDAILLAHDFSEYYANKYGGPSAEYCAVHID